MAPSSRLLVPIFLALFGPGCGQESPPEQFASTLVKGKVQLGPASVTGGWIQFQPIDGTIGNLRIAPIRPDGTFEAERVPVGRVAIGLDHLQVRAASATGSPLDLRAFRSIRSPIRRTIPNRPDAELLIDLFEEAARVSRSGRRRRNREKRKSSGESGLVLADPPDPHALPRLEPRVRVIYRDGSGTIHLDWPAARIPEAVADLGGTLWVDIEDIEAACNTSVEAMLRDVFKFHTLAIEDALQDTHVPKLDDWNEYIYLVVDTIDFDPETDDLRLHELDVFLGPNYLLTYHNESIDALERHRDNLIREPVNRLKHGSDHLLYRFLDDVVGEFLPAINHLDDAIEDVQDEVFDYPTPRTLQKIFQIKRSALRIHRTVVPMREVLNRLARDTIDVVDPDHRIYFRDVYDHLVRIHDIVESLRDLISGALDTYLSVVSNRTNDIMKALTIVNVAFLPMTFLVGFFGMNFFGDTLMFNRPALPKEGLFSVACLIMFGMPIIIAIIARRRGWI